MNQPESEASRSGARQRGLSLPQLLVLMGTAGLCVGLAITSPDLLARMVHHGLVVLFVAATAWRFWAAAQTLERPLPVPERLWPRYTVMTALRGEASMAPQIVRRLSALDYPRDRLQVLILLEADDPETQAAFAALTLPVGFRVVVCPQGLPATKPRALNLGLALAEGDFVVVYDAEDEPHPGQLKEAVNAFSAYGPQVACLQSPLRIRPDRRRRGRRGAVLLDRQFAFEYAALFEVILPAMSRLGAPVPLGGTSNHLRAAVLRRLGGWDAYNVTEDADLGFRLGRGGYRTHMLALPTWEPPPGPLSDWLPQRARWLKGFMQTWGVHTRDVAGLGLKGLATLQLTLGAAIVSAAVQSAVLAWLAASLLTGALQGVVPRLPLLDLAVLIAGWSAAVTTCVVGARRAGLSYGVFDALVAPAYWCLLSLAWIHAVWQLIRRPFHWNKTRHWPSDPAEDNDRPALPMTGRAEA